MSVQVTLPVDALASFHYYRKDADMAALVATGRLRLIGDSGAFSAWSQGAPINLDEYAAWVAKWRQHLLWAASLDVIGDPVATWRNWVALRDRHSLVTVPTLHAGADPVWLDRYAAEGVDMLGLGGMADPRKAVAAFRWALNVFRQARQRHPNVRFHLWGVTANRFLLNLPAYSADASGILGQASRFGNLRIFDPMAGRFVVIRLTGRNVYRVAPLLRRVYGVDPSAIETSHPGNRQMLFRLLLVSKQLYVRFLVERHHVQAPASLNGEPEGTRIHTADTAGCLKLITNGDLQ